MVWAFVGHYEGDTLVIDTVGVKTDRKYAMLDLFGTPYSKSLHVVERYRLREYEDVKDAIERGKNENWLPAGDVFSPHRGKFLQAHVTIEDKEVFTTPWTGTLTYVPARRPTAGRGLCRKHASILLQRRGRRSARREAGFLRVKDVCWWRRRDARKCPACCRCTTGTRCRIPEGSWRCTIHRTLGKFFGKTV